LVGKSHSRIAQMREARGWSQSELGRRAGLGQGHINEIEAMDPPQISLATLEKLARAFAMPRHELLRLIDTPEAARVGV
jgi:transcriptional regulator with XRE-family HTH domain